MRRAFRIMGIIGILLLLNSGCSKKSTKSSDDQEQPPPTLTGKIVFVSDRTGADELYSMNSQGTEVETLTHSGSQFPDKSYPRLSPDGTKIAFIASGNLCIFDYTTGSTEILVPVSDSIECHLGVSWSPDLKRICLCAYTNHLSDDIWLIDIATEVLTRLTYTTQPWEQECYPAWSPEGNLIAFCAGDSLCSMNIYGSEVAALSDGCCHMDWSPDASKIVYQYEGVYTQISLMNSDGTDKVELTFGSHPAFSPDGKQIVFCRNGDYSNYQIYRMNTDGSELVKLSTSDQYNDSDPDW